MFSEDPILLPEIVDQIVLVTVHPGSEREDEELQRRRHSLRLLGRLDQHRPSLGRFFAPYALRRIFTRQQATLTQEAEASRVKLVLLAERRARAAREGHARSQADVTTRRQRKVAGRRPRRSSSSTRSPPWAIRPTWRWNSGATSSPRTWSACTTAPHSQRARFHQPSIRPPPTSAFSATSRQTPWSVPMPNSPDLLTRALQNPTLLEAELGRRRARDGTDRDVLAWIEATFSGSAFPPWRAVKGTWRRRRLCCNFRAATSGWTTFGKHRTGSPIMPSDNPFKWRQFEPALILQCVRWYLRYALSYRDLKDMMRERGLCVDHTTIYRWVQRYAPEIDKRCRPFLRRTNDSYRIDETYVRVAGAWTYLYRGVDSNGDTLDFVLRATRDRKAAIAFFRKTLGAAHTTPPRVVTVDKNPAYPVAFEAVRHEGLVRPRSNLRQCKYLNNIIEQDHRFIKRRTRPMLGFKRFTTAWRTLRGIEIMHALRKGQARWMAKGDVVGQTQLIHKVFGLAA